MFCYQPLFSPLFIFTTMPREGCERLGAERSGARERSAPCSSLTGVQRRTRPELIFFAGMSTEVLSELIAHFFCKAEHVFDVEYFAIIENSLAADAPEYLMLIGGNH
jgi:hypothetical protein